MFPSPYTSPSQHGPYANLGPSDYSSPYYLDPCSFSYGECSASPSHFPPITLPDLYYDYGLETSPSSSSSEMIHTPPSAPTPPLPSSLDFTGPAYPQTQTCQPNNSAIGTEIYYEYPAMCSAKRQETLPHPMPYPHEVLDSPLITRFVSPLDTLLGPWVPTNQTGSALSLQSQPKLHQPRPSRRIPIVNLDELASACETSRPSFQGDHEASRTPSCMPCQRLSTRPFQPIEERVPLCLCGCMEPYRLQ